MEYKSKATERGLIVMKYKKIYEVIRQHPVKSVTDTSGWFVHPSVAVMPHQLWLVIETEHNIRIWVSHSFGRFSLNYADMSISSNDRAYSRSHREIEVKNQTETAEKLKNLLKSTREELYGTNKE